MTASAPSRSFRKSAAATGIAGAALAGMGAWVIAGSVEPQPHTAGIMLTLSLIHI